MLFLGTNISPPPPFDKLGSSSSSRPSKITDLCWPEKKPRLQMTTYFPPAREASREVANLTVRKNPHTPYMVSNNFWQEIITLTRTIRRGVWNLPQKFHLYLTLRFWVNIFYCALSVLHLSDYKKYTMTYFYHLSKILMFMFWVESLYKSGIDKLPVFRCIVKIQITDIQRAELYK